MIKHIAFAYLLVGYSLSFGILNTEPLPTITSPGLHQSLTISGSFFSGNNNYISIQPKYQLNFQSIQRPHLQGFVTTQVNYAKSETNIVKNSTFLNTRLLQQRSATQFTEYFIQLSSNSFINLKQRFLVGILNRKQVITTPKQSLTVKGGLMFEHEYLSESATATPIIRASLCFISSYTLSNNGSLNLITYIQPKLDEPNDTRGLVELLFNQALTNHINLQTSLDIFYDHIPPSGVKPIDSQITQKIMIKF